MASRMVRHVRAVGDGLAAHLSDLVHDLLRRPVVGTRPVQFGAQVVDHHGCAKPRQEQRHRPADSPAGTGDDGYPPIQSCHVLTSLPRLPAAGRITRISY
jgi:hypothetical protein